MSNEDLHQKLDSESEITLTVKGRKSGKDIQDQYGLHMKIASCICFQYKVRILTGTRTCYLIQ